ncbi:MAG: type II secretion system protein [Sphingomonas sp.]|jgi:prepilin-type N-terminal cleavage/methylation domain-containing protein
MRPARAATGFTLVETLIASAIIAAMLGVALQAVLASARAKHMVEDRRLATLVARSQLAAAAASTGAGLLDARGKTSNIDWRVRIEPFSTRFAQPRLEQIIVTTGQSPSGKPLVELRSVRLAP